MDLVALTFEVAFAGALVVGGALLLFTYLAFVRMHKDVRRARMFLMADRVRRFLGAFTAGFLLVAAGFLLSLAEAPSTASLVAALDVLFLAAIVYGSLELFLIVRPRRSALERGARPPSDRASPHASPVKNDDERAGGDRPAAR